MREDLAEVDRWIEVDDVVSMRKPRFQGRSPSQPPMGRAVVLALEPRVEAGVEIRKAPDGRFVQGAKENVAYRPKNSFYFPLLCG